NQSYPPDPRAPGYPQTSEPDYAAPTIPNNTRRSASTGDSSLEDHREHYVDTSGNQVENQVETYEDKNLGRANMRNWVATVIYFLLGVLEVILGLRFIFRLLGASMSSDFVTFLYNLSHGFVTPFNGIFNDQTLSTHSVFEVSTLVAMLIYALIGWGLVALSRVLFAPIYQNRQQITTTRRSR
ncbi:MAG: hypothetical protein ACRDHW_03985, partial [Ktedonobacteraceae bacterium]